MPVALRPGGNPFLAEWVMPVSGHDRSRVVRHYGRASQVVMGVEVSLIVTILDQFFPFYRHVKPDPGAALLPLQRSSDPFP